MKRKKKTLVFALILLCLLFTGCRKASSPEPSQPETTPNIDYVLQYQSQEKNDLFAAPWKRAELTNASQFMTFTDYIPQIFPNDQKGDCIIRGYFADSHSMYSLCTHYALEDDGLYHDTSYLNILDGVTRQVQTITYKKDQGILGLMMMQPYLSNGRIFTTSFSIDEEGIPNEYCMVELMTDGTYQKMKDLSAILADKHMLPDPYSVPCSSLFYEPANNRYYLISPDHDSLFLIDGEGELMPDLDETQAREIYLLASTEDGRLIFVREDNNTSTCFYYDGVEKKQLFSCNDGVVGGYNYSTVDTYGRMLFSHKNAVIQWDTVTGSQERLFVDNTMDESYNMQYIDCVMRNTNGEILTLRNNTLRVMTMNGPAKQATIEIKPLLYYDDQLKRSIRKYEQTHPGITIKLLETSRWETRDRDIIELMQEMTNGSGADLLLLDRSQMLSFDKNECLMDLSEVLVDATKKQLLSGVLEYGRTNHGTMLLSYQPYLKTAFINKKYLNGSSWTVQNLVDIIEAQEKQGKPFTLLTRGDYHPFFLFLTNICDSEFIDMEKGTCSFNSDLFIKVLEICKRYNNEIDYNEDAYDQIKKGEILTLTPTELSLRGYSEVCANLGPDYVTVGYPSLSGNGHHLSFSMGFAVNKNTENYDIIADFINWMFSLENENLLFQAPIREDLFEGRIRIPTPTEVANGWEDSPYVALPDRGGIWPLAAKPDGDSYLKEYMELVEQCHYRDTTVYEDDITRILWEEADAFFEGDNRSAAEVARIIQSRVFLYLQENR